MEEDIPIDGRTKKVSDPRHKMRTPPSTPQAKTEDKLSVISDFLTCNFTANKEFYEDLIDSSRARLFTFRKPELALGVSGWIKFAAVKRGESRDELRARIRTDMEEKCLETKFRIVKIFRMKAEQLLKNHEMEMMDLLPKGTKVILLVRDPRAVANSMARFKSTWSPETANLTSICQRIVGMVDTASLLPPERILLVKYRRLVLRPEVEFSRVVKFLGLSQGEAEEILNSAQERMSFSTESFIKPQSLARGRLLREIPSRRIRTKSSRPIDDMDTYWTTFRNQDFTPDTWKKELSQDTLNEIESIPVCKKALIMLQNLPSDDK